MTVTLIIVGLMGGLLFAVMDALINANPLAVRLYAVFKPIVRTRLNMPVALAIDLAYGLIMAGIFVLLHGSLPGDGVVKGLAFGLLAWFFRVVMQAASQWVMYTVPFRSVLYGTAAGLAEMLVLGTFYGLALPAVP